MIAARAQFALPRIWHAKAATARGRKQGRGPGQKSICAGFVSAVGAEFRAGQNIVSLMQSSNANLLASSTRHPVRKLP